MPLVSVNLGRGDDVTGLLGGNITYGLSGSRSTMTMSADKKTVTIVLGTYDSTFLGPVRTTAGDPGTLTWTPAAGPKDLAGNPLATPITTATESAPADKDF